MTDPLDEALEDAIPRCPRCLVTLDVHGPADLPYLECPVCADVYL